jgi:hypothetical protein
LQGRCRQNWSYRAVKRRIDRDDGFQPALPSGRHGQRVLLRDADIEKRPETGPQTPSTRADGHCGRYGDEKRVLFRKRDHRLAEHAGIAFFFQRDSIFTVSIENGATP